MNIKKTQPVSIFLNEELKEKLKEESKKQERSRSQLIRISIKKYLGEIENGQIESRN